MQTDENKNLDAGMAISLFIVHPASLLKIAFYSAWDYAGVAFFAVAVRDSAFIASKVLFAAWANVNQVVLRGRRTKADFLDEPVNERMRPRERRIDVAAFRAFDSVLDTAFETFWDHLSTPAALASRL
jgi:hypothetical protein